MLRRFLFASLCCAACATTGWAELVSYWPLDEFPDESSTPDVVRGYDMQLFTDGFFGAENHVDGKFGKAFQFFNQNDAPDDTGLFAYEAEEGDLLPINLQPEFTISMWANVKGEGQNDWRLFSESNSLGDGNPLFNIGTANNGNDDSLDIYIRNGALANSPDVNHARTNEHPFTGEWSHIGWTFADGMHNVYVNGVFDSSHAHESFGDLDPPNINATSIGGILRANASHWVTGIIDDVAVWNEVLPGATIAGLAQELTNPLDALDYEGVLPPFAVEGRGEVGTSTLPGAIGNTMFGEPVGPNSPGLLQSWYGVGNPGSKAGVDEVFSSAERLVPAFHSDDSTWWSGSQAVTDVQTYPFEVEDAMTERGGNNYTVKLEGEILIPESGLYRFLDGVDDYTYFAVDIDRSGVAGDADGEVLINDNSWTNALSTGNGGAAIVEQDFTVAEGGEWLAMEFNMAEGGGGDHGMLYWDYSETDGVNGNEDFFPLAQGDGVDDLDAFILMIPDTHLRGPAEPAPLLSGDVSADVPSRESGWEIDVNPADGTADAFALENPDDSIYTTKLNVDGIEFHINALGDVNEGDSFQFLVADEIIGTPVIATDGWSFDAATGSVVFGAVMDSCGMGDLDGNGIVEFADFLVLSGNFGQAVGSCAEGDIDGDGSVAFADFLVLSGNFGQQVGAQSVPEPAGFAMLGLAGVLAGLLRKRRS